MRKKDGERRGEMGIGQVGGRNKGKMGIEVGD